MSSRGATESPARGAMVEMVLPPDHPICTAWASYKETKDFADIKRWAGAVYRDQHLDGCLWAVFCVGYLAAQSAARLNGKGSTE